MKDVFELQIEDLLYFVKASCHEGLHDVMVEIREIVSGMEKGHLTSFVKGLILKIQRHLMMEENNLFPSIDSGKKTTLLYIISVLVDEHDEIKKALMEIRSLTHNYHPHLELDDKGMSLYHKLKEMDRIILNHIQIEDNILFPMVLST